MNKLNEEIKIVGPTVKTIWDREVDLTQVPESSILQFDNYEFQYLTFIRMPDFRKNPKSFNSLNNVGVRADNAKDENFIMSMYADYMKRGVDLNEPVPPITVDGELIDARGRTYTHLENNQEWMMFGVYKPTVNLNEEVRSLKTSGLVANIHQRPARNNTLNDYISCGISLQSQGYLGHTDTQVKDWLVEAKFFEAFPSALNKSNGLVMRVVNAIKNKSVSNIRVMSASEVIEWCNNQKRSGFPNVDKTNVVILNTKSEDYILRLLKKFQKEYPFPKKIKIILWTSQKDYRQAKSDMKSIKTFLENEWIQRNRMLGQSTKTDEMRPIPWEILGCVPQFEDEGHVLNSLELIAPDDY